MAKDVVVTKDDRYAARIFFNCALPLLKVVSHDYPSIRNKFKNKNFVFQVSAIDSESAGGKWGTHFVINGDDWQVKVSQCHESPDVEFEFPNLKDFVLFFANKSKKLPKIKGMAKLGKLMAVLSGLLKMAGLLNSKDVPTKDEDAKELVKLFFYLLTNGISQLNKAGHPKVAAFVKPQPDRIWALQVANNAELASWLRVKEGNSKSGRGINERCAPFLTMEFDSVPHALDVLMDKADLSQYIASKYLVINGAPEMSLDFSDMLLTVGYYAQGKYLADQA